MPARGAFPGRYSTTYYTTLHAREAFELSELLYPSRLGRPSYTYATPGNTFAFGWSSYPIQVSTANAI